MTDMLRSMMRFSWAMSLFGARQAQEMFQAFATAQTPRRAAGAFDAVADTAAEQLGGAFGQTYRTVDRLQGQIIDGVFGALDPAVDLTRDMTSKTMVRGSLAMLRQATGLLEAALPGQQTGWCELRNKLEAFENFQYVGQILGFADLAAADLERQVGEAGGSGPYLRLWLTEGLGFAYAETAWHTGRPDQLLRLEGLDRLPEECLIPLHTGMGLALARHTLPDLLAASTQRIPGELGRFARLCENNARDGFALAVFEALGLMVRQLAPERVTEIDAALAADEASGRRGAFWHGLGRGLYFVVSQVFPGSTGRAVAKVRQEASSDLARLNALSGLAWALTLVNFRQPQVLEDFLVEQSFGDEEGAAVAAGIAAATLLWRDAAGEDSYLEAFRAHQPPAAHAEIWQRWVNQPCAAAGQGWAALKSQSGAGEIFHYRPGG
ncbi:MAG: hypothetical protein AAF657_11890 [Acidobacteriota bacterium]